MLPDLALRGTLYSPRVGTLLAVIAIIAGVPTLRVPALFTLESAKGTWLAAPLVPENFNMDLIKLLLSLPHGSESGNLGNVALTTAEHTSYLSQLRYSNLFTQLDSKVTGHIGWTPFKSRGVGDRKRKCLRCGIRRSETMMHDLNSLTEGDREKLGLSGKAAGESEGACGMCVDCDTKNPEDWKDMGESMSCWVECSEAYCKASYVIEDEEGLRVCMTLSSAFGPLYPSYVFTDSTTLLLLPQPPPVPVYHLHNLWEPCHSRPILPCPNHGHTNDLCLPSVHILCANWHQDDHPQAHLAPCDPVRERV
jgi:hypothetical protein